MGSTQKLGWETLRSFDSVSLSGYYQAIGTPLAQASFKCKIVNNSNVLVTISIDGLTDIDVAPAGSFWLYDEGITGLSGSSPGVPKGTQFFIKGSAGSGSIYLVSQYIVIQ